MLRIHFTAADFAGVRFAARPSPLQELNAALVMMYSRHDALLFGRWRQRLQRSLPVSAGALRELAPGSVIPSFLDVVSGTLHEGLEAVRASRPEVVRAEIERAYDGVTAPVPPWIRGLHQGEAGAWQFLIGAQQAAFEVAVRPAWPLVQDLHRAEFTRHALAVAEHGIGRAVAGLIPGSRLDEDVWHVEAPQESDIKLGGRGLLLLPAFHRTGHPLTFRLADGTLVLTYPAGPGLPLSPAGAGSRQDALAGVLGRARAGILLLLAEERTTSQLARRLRVSNATASAHTAALRRAGLITTTRAGRAVLHQRTALGTLLAGEPGAASRC